MNKSEFLLSLQSHLSALPPEERNELMEDYEAHFTFALQNGRTEQEVILELGQPAELAKEALGNRYIPEEPVYWYGAGSPSPNPSPSSNPIDSPARQEVPRRGGFASSMVFTGLFFVDIVVGPLLLALWAIWFSIAVTAFGGIISPLALGMEYVWHQEFIPAKGYAVLAMVGIGILFAVISKGSYKIIKNLTLALWAWHSTTARGEQR